MIKIFYFSIMCLLMIWLIMLIMNMNIYLIKHNKMNSFECGFNSNSLTRLPFSLHFFLLTCLFLIFDSEITLIFPSLICVNSNIKHWMIIMMLIIMILFISIILEWKKNYLIWLMWNM